MDRALGLTRRLLLPREKAAGAKVTRAWMPGSAGDVSRDQLDNDVPEYTRGEEIAHWLTHGAGAVLSLAGLALLMVVATTRGDVWHQVSFAIFGTALAGTYTISTLYHLGRDTSRQSLLRRLDHAAIFILIAGTYTP